LIIKWIFFDFGGCLDSDGEHSRTLFFNEFQKNFSLNFSFFQEAYSFCDKLIISESLVLNSDLKNMNRTMCQLIADYLKLSENEKVKNIADSISQKQAYFLKRNSRSLFLLKRNHKLGIVSNFSGNLELILAEFSLNEYFDFVLDSYHVGLEKPSLDFFKIALTKAKAIEKSILFVGDNLDRDIRPAKKLGLQTVLINPTLKKSIADFTLHSIEVLPNIF